MSRTRVTGPFAGAYAVIDAEWGVTSITPGAVTTTMKRLVPADFRVSQIDIATVSSAGGASRPTLQVTDGTNNLLSGSLSATSNGVASATPTSSPSLVAAQRSRTKADTLQIQVTTVASEAVVGLAVKIHGFYVNHVVAASVAAGGSGESAEPND
jgi:hypothetical protein